MMATSVDVVVVGAGVVGAAAALALADSGFDVALIEREGPTRVRGALGFDPRAVALSPASRTLLAALGGWPDEGACTYQRMTVWDADGTGQLSFAGSDLDPPAPALGYIVELSALTTCLWRALGLHPRVRLYAPAALTRLTIAPRGVDLADGTHIKARVIVGADGANSLVRRLAGGQVRARVTGQVAIAGVARHELPHTATAWQRFTPTGPLAFLPLPDPAGAAAEQRYSAIVWSCDVARGDELSALDDEQFAGQLTTAFEARLGRVLAVAPRVRVPLTQQQAQRYQPRPGVVLIGDAAHVVHPLAGQGMNLGLRDMRVLTEVLSRAVDVPAALGEPALLELYEARARTVNTLAIAFMAGIQGVFGDDRLLVRGARNQGLRLVERLPALKAQFALEAMGHGLLIAP